jgi:hypothetical protein
VTAVANGCFFAKQPLIMPRDDVRDSGLYWHDTTGAHIFFDGAHRGDVLDDPLVTAFRFGATTARGAENV